ncbi:putative peptide modification system cyclase [Pseudomarimonas arenosa]|uniref:Peptide modification system cyclase n=1 Tax=Pseudomarimonas arenosa TaxID=2774145 RepID=A0AAW3ZI70_9GAMM|nr:putative peptide modification system cyclase [Pseudomarimonas arenosa]MBD8525780.1 putative peptide modification system cyclase [Pseudomarimonas arenosa]
MDSRLASPPAAAEPKAIKATPHLGCLLLCDLANSTRLIEQLGDSRAAQLIRRHDQLARDTLHRFHGQEIDKTDGFLVLFDRPIEAVSFALAYQNLLRELGQEAGYPLAARVGIHVGEILSWRNSAEDIAQGAKPIEIEGLAKAIAARLMGLAKSGQILLSESAYSLAFRAREELAEVGSLRWISHGEYRLHGVSRRMSVFEVGVPPIAPLSPPKSKAKAKRIVPWWQWKPLYLLLFGAIASAMTYVFLQPEPAIAFAERDWIVVADLNNHSGDPRFNESLDTAIRLGLEQSRHVNLVNHTKVRDTLRLMRQPADVPVQRSNGSEVAQRLGARALLLPNLVELGGRWRFTAELIDPRTGTTVYAEFADARDESQILAAVNSSLNNVRSRLGESMSAITAASEPLGKITSNNVDALRGYALALKAKNRSEIPLARELLRHALDLDPEFAMAMSLMAALNYMEGDSAAAASTVADALRLRDRLSAVERAHLAAVLAFYRGDDDAANKWLALVTQYPDRHYAHHLLAVVLARDNLYQEARRALEPALNPLHPGLNSANYQAGLLELGLGDLSTANERFEQAMAQGTGGDLRAAAFARWLSGQRQAAIDLLSDKQEELPAELAALNLLGLAVLDLEAGAVDQALSRLQALQQAPRLSDGLRDDIRLSSFAVQCLLRGQPNAPDWHNLAFRASADNPAAQQILATRWLLAAGIATRCGQAEVEVPAAPPGDSPMATHFRQWYEGEKLLAQGKAAAALSASSTDADKANAEPYLLRDLRRRALLATGDSDAAAVEADWLRRHHGRSLVEYNERLHSLAVLNAALRVLPTLESATPVATAMPAP